MQGIKPTWNRAAKRQEEWLTSSGSREPVSECYRYETSAVGNLCQPVSYAGVNETPLPVEAVSCHFPFEEITSETRRDVQKFI